MFSSENNLINTDSVLGNNPNINLSSTENSYGLNINQNSYHSSGLGTSSLYQDGINGIRDIYGMGISSVTTLSSVDNQPDLIVQNVSAPTTTTVGSTIQLNYEVKNQGNASADYSYSKFYLSKDASLSSDDVFLNYDSVTNIGAGGVSSESVALTISNFTAAGNYYLLSQADSYSYVAESNNIVASAISLTTLAPDLILQNVSAPSSTTVGSTIQLSYQVKNQGNASAGSSSYSRFYLSKDATLSSDDVFLNWDDVTNIGAGGVSSESVALTITNRTAAGNYYLLSQADSYSYVAESNESNNIVASAISLTTLAPDLIVQNVSAPSNTTVGSTIQLSYQVKNQGNASAGSSSYSRFYLSKDATLSSDDVFFNWDDVTNIGAGAVSSESVALTIANGTAAGNYYLLSQADAYSYVAESNESNNVFAKAISLTTSAPNLIVQNVSAPSSTTVGSTIQLSYQVKNQGNAVAGSSYSKFYLSKDATLSSDDVFLNNDYVTNIGAGAVSSESVALTIANGTAAGNYYLLSQADAYSYVAESNESNNVFAKAISLTTSAPDLIVQNVSAPSSTTVGSTIQLNYQVKNQGNAVAGSSYSKFYLSKDATLSSDDVFLNNDYVTSIGAGGVSSESVALTIANGTAAGNYYLLSQADAYSYVAESNESNNVFASAISLTTSAISLTTLAPDLIVQNVSAPSSTTVGSTIQLSYQVKNQGNASARSSITSFYLSKDASLSSDDVYLNWDDVTNIGAGGVSSESVALTITNGTAAGNYYLLSQADSDGYLAESNEINNVFAKAISLTTLAPDLIVQNVSAPSSTTVGSTIQLSYQVKNQGNASARSSITSFYLSKDASLSSDDVYLNWDDVTNIGAGGVSSESVALTITNGTAAGNYYLLSQADGYTYVAESNESNNVFAKAISLTTSAPDLIVQNVSAPSSTTVGSTIQLNYQVKNQGNASTGFSYTSFYLSKDASLSSDDVFLINDDVTSVGAGGVSSESVALTIANGTAASNYYLLSQADGYSYVAESNESNNVFAKAISLTTSAPDLIVQNVSAPSSTTVGSTIQLNYQVKNQGNASTGFSYTSFYLSKDASLSSDDVFLINDDVTSVGAGGVSSESVALTIANGTAAGNYYLLSQADGYTYVAESNESNNIVASAIYLTTPAPDLIVQNVSAPSTTTVGGSTIRLNYEVKNQGNASADSSYSKFYLSKDATLSNDDVFLTSDNVTNIGAGGVSSKSVVLTIANGTAAGNYYLLSQADSYGFVAESNESNNIFANAITVQETNNDWYSQNLKDAGLINLTCSLAADGNLSRNDMISLFRDAEDNSEIDATELVDLRTIVSNSSPFTMLDYVRVLSDNVVNGNTANQWWTGGSTSSTTLGNLFAGSSAAQMEKLIGKWFLGSDRPTASSSANYQTINGSLFQNGISADDIKQGVVGDCYYLATLSSIAQEKPNYIQNMFIDNGDNTFTVRFFNNAVANYVTVDQYLPTNAYGQLIYASPGSSYNNSSNELWVALAEKAYAQLGELGWSRPDNTTNAYSSIEGGWMEYVTRQVTGLDATRQQVTNMSKTQLIELVNSNKVLTAGFVDGVNYGVVNNHAYSVSSYNAANGTFRVRNPWGFQDADVTWDQLLDLKTYFAWSNT